MVRNTVSLSGNRIWITQITLLMCPMLIECCAGEQKEIEMTSHSLVKI